MTEAAPTRTRRPFPGLFPYSHYDIKASETEVSNDLQQFYQCSSSQIAVLFATQTAGGSARNKVKLRQRKRTFSSKESEVMDAVLGLASLVSESEMPVNPNHARPKRHVEPNAKPKPKPAPKPVASTSHKPRAKPPPAPAAPRQPPTPVQYQLPFGYPFANYLYPYLDKSQMMMMPGLTLPSQPLYPPFGMMYSPAMYGTPGWTVPVASSAAVLVTSTQQSRMYKRSARHVAIALFIRGEEGKRKTTETGSPSKYARLM
jgi:hypothetical protein